MTKLFNKGGDGAGEQHRHTQRRSHPSSNG